MIFGSIIIQIFRAVFTSGADFPIQYHNLTKRSAKNFRLMYLLYWAIVVIAYVLMPYPDFRFVYFGLVAAICILFGPLFIYVLSRRFFSEEFRKEVFLTELTPHEFILGCFSLPLRHLILFVSPNIILSSFMIDVNIHRFEAASFWIIVCHFMLFTMFFSSVCWSFYLFAKPAKYFFAMLFDCVLAAAGISGLFGVLPAIYQNPGPALPQYFLTLSMILLIQMRYSLLSAESFVFAKVVYDPHPKFPPVRAFTEPEEKRSSYVFKVSFAAFFIAISFSTFTSPELFAYGIGEFINELERRPVWSMTALWWFIFSFSAIYYMASSVFQPPCFRLRNLEESQMFHFPFYFIACASMILFVRMFDATSASIFLNYILAILTLAALTHLFYLAASTGLRGLLICVLLLICVTLIFWAFSQGDLFASLGAFSVFLILTLRPLLIEYIHRKFAGFPVDELISASDHSTASGIP